MFYSGVRLDDKGNLYCHKEECHAAFEVATGKKISDQDRTQWLVFREWWNKTTKEIAEREGKELKVYHVAANGDYVEGGSVT